MEIVFRIALFAILVMMLLTIVLDPLLQRFTLRDKYVRITDGKYKGREGKVVNDAWLFNLYHRFNIEVNVPANEAEIRARFEKGWGDRVTELIDQAKEGYGPRHGAIVSRKQIEVT